MIVRPFPRKGLSEHLQVTPVCLFLCPVWLDALSSSGRQGASLKAELSKGEYSKVALEECGGLQ
eukprot:2901509-Amphidinium_carterae.3